MIKFPFYNYILIVYHTRTLFAKRNLFLRDREILTKNINKVILISNIYFEM